MMTTHFGQTRRFRSSDARGGGAVKETRVELDKSELRKMVKLCISLTLAVEALTRKVSGGDYHWHGGKEPFKWEGVKMDAPTFVEYARDLLATLETKPA